jgi:hypothetical protein
LSKYVTKNKKLGVALHDIVNKYLNAGLDLEAADLGIFAGIKLEEIILWSITLAWFLLLSATLVLLSHKLNKLSAMMTLICYQMNIPQGLEAKVLGPGYRSLTTETSKSDNGEVGLHELILSLYDNHAPHLYQFLQLMALVCVALILAQVAHFLRAVYQTIFTFPCNCRTTLYAQLMNNDSTVALPVQTFSLPMHRCNVTLKPTISMIDSYTYKLWSPYIEIVWSSRLHLSYLGQTFDYSLPTRVNCPWVSRSAVNAIMNKRQTLPVFAFMSMSAECICSSGLIKKAKRSMVQRPEQLFPGAGPDDHMLSTRSRSPGDTLKKLRGRPVKKSSLPLRMKVSPV